MTEFSEGSKAKSPSNAAYFPPILFLMIINILITTIKLFFYFIFVIIKQNLYKQNKYKKETNALLFHFAPKQSNKHSSKKNK